MISETTTNEMIRVWRRARLSRDNGHLGYPKINILHPKHGVGDDDEPEENRDVEIIQSIVENMPDEIRFSFEAFHLWIIRNQFCRKRPHKWRWLVLGIDKIRYESRRLAGHQIIRECLLTSTENSRMISLRA